VAQSGRSLGPRALRTRLRILDAAARLFEERGVLDLSVVDIARAAGTSPATFYHYFKDVEEVAVELAERAADEMPVVFALIEGSWRGEVGLDRARSIVDWFIRHWETHRAVLLLRNMESDRGNHRFHNVRRDALGPLLSAFTAELSRAQAAGRVASEIHPWVASAAIGSLLELIAAHQETLLSGDATRDDLVETCARIITQTVTGRAPR
jgi:AcrR family transcriptional regulator